MVKIQTNLVIIPVDHPNCRTTYYRQKELCRIALNTLKPGDVLAIEDDESNEVPVFFAPIPKEARVVGWYDPKIYAEEKELLKIDDAIKRLEFDPLRPKPRDVHTLIGFTSGKFRPEIIKGNLELPDLISLSRTYYNRLFNQKFDENWSRRQLFLMKKIENLSDEGVKTIYLVGGRLHFDEVFLKFVTCLGISYQIIDQQPQPMICTFQPSRISIFSN